MADFRCAAASTERAEPQFATASRVARWMLVEQPGPWGSESVPSSRLRPDVTAHLQRLAGAAGARLLLIRKPLGVPAAPGRTLYLADSRIGRELLLSRQWPGTGSPGDGVDLLTLRLPDDWHQGADWTVRTDPLWLVCTQGRHDPCCAIWGRPVAAALATEHPQNTWECSHLGGDRFAGNLLALPGGYYFGRVPPAMAPQLVAGVAQGRLAPDQLRGRSSLSLPVQAAQHFARGRLGVHGIDDLAPVRQESLGVRGWQVTLAGPDGPVVVTVGFSRTGERHRLTCHAREEMSIPAFHLVSITS